MNYEVDILIDENALEIEWLEQPALAVKYGKIWAKAARTLQRAEEKIKLIRAELIVEVTSDPENYLGAGIKATGPTIEGYYRTHERHMDAKEAIVDAQYELNIAEIAKKEISTTRKAALQNMVTLYGLNYFAGPSMPRELDTEIQKRHAQKKVDAGVATKLNRKKK